MQERIKSNGVMDSWHVHPLALFGRFGRDPDQAVELESRTFTFSASLDLSVLRDHRQEVGYPKFGGFLNQPFQSFFADGREGEGERRAR